MSIYDMDIVRRSVAAAKGTEVRAVLRDLLRVYEATGDHDHGQRAPTEGDGDCVACRARRILKNGG